MNREGALLLMAGIAVILLLLMSWGWRRRLRRDRALTSPFGEPPASSLVDARFAVLYVASCVPGKPLERLAMQGLAYRASGELSLVEGGLVLDLDGSERIFITRDR